MNPIAKELNQVIQSENPHLMEMLSDIGKQLFFPRGILSQGAEAREKAHKLNATIGIATEANDIMCLESVKNSIKDITPRASLTYAPSFGIPDLRKAWQAALFEKNHSLAGKTISLPVVTCGITHAISMFADIWIDPGDVVILPDMMWGNYNMIFGLRKAARVRSYPIFTSSGAFNVKAFEEAVKDEAVTILTDIAKSGNHVLAVTDDSYFGLFYEPETLKESLFARFCGQDPRLLAVKLDGCTKENFVWGLRVGFITYGLQAKTDLAATYDALEKKTAGCIRGNISNASHLGQSIVLKSMQNENFTTEKKDKFNILKKRANTVKAVLSDAKYQDAWDVYPFNSGYFMCIRLKSVNAEKLRVHLLETYGVGMISIGDDKLRVAFSCLEENDIQTLFDIVLQGVHDLS